MNLQHWLELAATVICAVFASNGFWTLLEKRREKKDAKTQMILGLGHDRIIHLCKYYIEQGFISADDLDNLYTYLYLPYKAMGGNGVAERLVHRVEELPTMNPNAAPRKENFEDE
jgi:hypothetical protein